MRREMKKKKKEKEINKNKNKNKPHNLRETHSKLREIVGHFLIDYFQYFLVPKKKKKKKKNIYIYIY